MILAPDRFGGNSNNTIAQHKTDHVCHVLLTTNHQFPMLIFLLCRGTGTATEMAIAERETLAFEGVIVVAVDVIRPKAAFSSSGGWAGAAAGGGGGGAAAAAGGLSCKARLTTRGMWTDQGKLLDTLHQVRIQGVKLGFRILISLGLNTGQAGRRQVKEKAAVLQQVTGLQDC
jgi:hypothetical protein